MPTAINGVGTTYFGKKNQNIYQGTCEFCGKPSQLIDYDTRYCICVLFIPVIPLGKKRILGECSHCRQHRSMRLSDWEDSVEAAVTECMLNMKNNPDDVNAAIELHQTFHQSGKEKEAAEIARLIKERFPRDFEAHFYLTTWYEIIGRPDEVRKSMQRAYELAPDNPLAKRGMAVVHIQQGELEKAEKLVDEIDRDSEHYDSGVLFLLAQAYQGQGKHDKAHAIFEKLNQTDPGFAKNRDFSKAVRRSEKTLGKRDSIVRPTPFYQQPWLIAVAILLLLVGGVTAYSFFLGGNRTVFLVNGLQKPISVRIDDETYQVAPGAEQKVSIAEGTHSVSLEGPPEEAQKHEPYEFTIESGFFDRLLDSSVTILDPSESAVYMHAIEYYSSNEDVDLLQKSLDNSSIFMFEKVRQFEDIDYPFQELPEEITVSNASTDRIYEKSAINLLDPGNGEAWFALEMVGVNGLTDEQKRERKIQLAERFLPDMEEVETFSLSENDQFLLSMYCVTLSTPEQYERAEAIFTQFLKEHPDDFDWVDTWFAAMENADREAEGRARISELAKEHPEVGAFQYVEALISPTFTEQKEILEDLHKRYPENLRLLLNLRRSCFTAQEFERAIEFDKKILAIEEGNRGGRFGEDEQETTTLPTTSEPNLFQLYCYYNLGQTELIEAYFQNLNISAPSDVYKMFVEFRVMQLLAEGREAEADEYLEEWKTSFSKLYEANSDYAERYAELLKDFWAGNDQAALDLISSSEDFSYDRGRRVELTILAGADYIATTEQLLEENGIGVEYSSNYDENELYDEAYLELFTVRLMLASKLMSEGKPADAQEQLESLLGKEWEDVDDREALEQMVDETPVTWQELQDLKIHYANRRMAFTYAALKYPELKPQVAEYLAHFWSTDALGVRLSAELLKNAPSEQQEAPEPPSTTEEEPVADDSREPAKAERPVTEEPVAVAE